MLKGGCPHSTTPEGPPLVGSTRSRRREMRKHHSRHRVARVLIGITGAVAGTATLSFTGSTPVDADTAPSYWMAHSGGHVDPVGGARSLGSVTPDSGATVV